MPKTVLITGATSGFGKASVHRFANAGWRVIATGRRAERLQKLVDELGADKVHAAAFDICDSAAMDDALSQRRNSLHMLVVMRDPFQRDEQWQRFNITFPLHPLTKDKTSGITITHKEPFIIFRSP